MERLPRVLARAGAGSRRSSAALITAGRVTVDGHVVRDPAFRLDPQRSVVRLDGRVLRVPREWRYVMLNKPSGHLSARRDKRGRATVMDLVPAEWRDLLFPVGRLDEETTGLLLLTNDGELAFRCTHPSYHLPKTYRATVAAVPGDHELRRLRSGLELEDGLTAPAEVWLRGRSARGALVEITLREGRNRQVRRMLEAVGHPVLALERVAFGPLKLGDLPRGEWRELEAGELSRLRQQLSLADG